MKLLSICFTTTVNQAATSFKNFNIPGNFTSDFSIHAIITCQCTFADNFISLVQHIVSSINGDLQLFI